MKNDWFISCKIFTCWVKTDDSSGITTIIDSAPILNRWIGQSLYKLLTHAKYNIDGMSLIKTEETEV